MSTWLGIDIGASTVTVAVVRTAYRKTALAGLALAVVDRSEGGLEGAIREAVAAAMVVKGAGDGIAVAIDGLRASVHLLGMPASAQRQLGDILRFELEAQLPYELDDAVFDHRVLGLRDDGQVDVLAGVARVADVRARIALVKAALRAEPERVTLGGLAYAHLAPFHPSLSEAGPVAVVELGPECTEVVILRAGDPVYARTLAQGTAGLPGNAPKLARDLRLSIGAYRAAGGAALERVYLSGPGATVDGAQGFLSGELEIPVEILGPPALETPTLTPEDLASFPLYARAVALALSLSGRGAGLNFRRGPLAYERGYGWIREKVPVLAGLAAVLVVSFFFSAWSRYYAYSKDVDVASKALAIVTKDVFGEEVSVASRARELLDQQVGTDDDPMPHADAFDVMVRLSEAVPPSITHDVEELDYAKGHVRLQGIVPNIPDTQTIASNLQTEPCFSDVKVTRTTKVVSGERQKYDLELDVKCPIDQRVAPKKHGAGGSSTSGSTD